MAAALAFAANACSNVWFQTSEFERRVSCHVRADRCQTKGSVPGGWHRKCDSSELTVLDLKMRCGFSPLEIRPLGSDTTDETEPK